MYFERNCETEHFQFRCIYATEAATDNAISLDWSFPWSMFVSMSLSNFKSRQRVQNTLAHVTWEVWTYHNGI